MLRLTWYPIMDANRLNGKHPWRHFAQGVPLRALAVIYNQILSFAAGILVARVIGASQYGVVSVARSILEILGIVSPLGLDLALQRHLGSGSGQDSTRLAQLTVFRSVAFVVGIAPAALAALGLSAYVEQPTFRAIVMITLFAFGWRLWAVVVGTSVSYVVSWIILAVRARRELAPTGATGGLDWADTLSVLRYSPSLAASLIFTTCIRSADSLFLGHFGTAADVGQYGAVVMVAQLIGLLGSALGQTLGARIALCHRNNDIAGMEGLLAENIRLTSLFSAPVFAAIVFWGDRIDLVLGPTFAVDASVVSIVAASLLVQTMFQSSGWALSMTGRHLRETGLLGIGLLASVVLCFALIPGHGQIGAALAGFISLSMVNVSRYAVVRSMFGIKHVKLAAIKPIAWAVAVAGATHLLLRPLDDRTVLFTLFEAVIFVMSFAVSAWFVLVTHQDREMIAGLFMPRPLIAGADE